MHDISVALRPGTPEWPGDVPFSCGWSMQMAAGANINLSHLAMSPHVGTHADAPLHVIRDAPDSGAFPLDVFRGPAYVLDLPESLQGCAYPSEACIELEDLEPLLPPDVQRLLIRTDASTAEGEFPALWPSLTPACVRAMCARGLRLLGVDAPSVDPREAKVLEAHRALFEGGGFNLENLDLRGVAQGWYELVAYPLRLDGLDAAPVRAVLLPMP
jgi:arylformamidase